MQQRVQQRVQQPEVAGGAAVRGSWEHMWCWPEVEVQQPEVAGSTEVQQPEVAGGVAARGSCEPEVEVQQQRCWIQRQWQCRECCHL